MAPSAPKSLHEALVAAQAEMPELVKDSTNPHFNSSFISLKGLLEQVVPVLAKHGLLLLQPPTTLEGGAPALTTILAHPSTGTEITFTHPLVISQQTAQAQGAAITYIRRYALMSLLCLVADEDDDGNAASAKPARATRARKTADKPAAIEPAPEAEAASSDASATGGFSAADLP